MPLSLFSSPSSNPPPRAPRPVSGSQRRRFPPHILSTAGRPAPPSLRHRRLLEHTPGCKIARGCKLWVVGTEARGGAALEAKGRGGRAALTLLLWCKGRGAHRWRRRKLAGAAEGKWRRRGRRGPPAPIMVNVCTRRGSGAEVMGVFRKCLSWEVEKKRYGVDEKFQLRF